MARIMTTGIIKTELNIKPLQFTYVKKMIYNNKYFI